jgi:hypothetical protein
MDAVKQALQLPSSVTAILASGIHTPSLKQTPSHPSNADITEQYNSPDHSQYVSDLFSNFVRYLNSYE